MPAQADRFGGAALACCKGARLGLCASLRGRASRPSWNLRAELVHVPRFGLIDLMVTWNAEWPQALEAGWSLYMTLFVGVPFTVIAVRGRAFLQAAVAQLYVAVGALIVSAIVASEWPLVLWAVVIALETMIIAGLPSPRPSICPPVRPSC
jgi:hypothetical protein